MSVSRVRDILSNLNYSTLECAACNNVMHSDGITECSACCAKLCLKCRAEQPQQQPCCGNEPNDVSKVPMYRILDDLRGVLSDLGYSSFQCADCSFIGHRDDREECSVCSKLGYEFYLCQTCALQCETCIDRKWEQEHPDTSDEDDDEAQ